MPRWENVMRSWYRNTFQEDTTFRLKPKRWVVVSQLKGHRSSRGQSKYKWSLGWECDGAGVRQGMMSHTYCYRCGLRPEQWDASEYISSEVCPGQIYREQCGRCENGSKTVNRRTIFLYTCHSKHFYDQMWWFSHHAIFRHQLSVPQFNSILTLPTWR